MSPEPTKIVKGGFRATLALLVSIVALVFSIVAYQRATPPAEYQAELNELKEKLAGMKQETAERIGKIRQETSNAMKKIGIAIEKQAEKPKAPDSQ